MRFRTGAGEPTAAHHLFEIIRRIERWAAPRDEIDINPFTNMDPPAPKAGADRLSGIERWRLHDLRRTARTGLAKLGVPQNVAETVLNHAERNVLVSTYDRHEYTDEKRDALEH